MLMLKTLMSLYYIFLCEHKTPLDPWKFFPTGALSLHSHLATKSDPMVLGTEALKLSFLLLSWTRQIHFCSSRLAFLPVVQLAQQCFISIC